MGCMNQAVERLWRSSSNDDEEESTSWMVGTMVEFGCVQTCVGRADRYTLSKSTLWWIALSTAVLIEQKAGCRHNKL